MSVTVRFTENTGESFNSWAMTASGADRMVVSDDKITLPVPEVKASYGPGTSGSFKTRASANIQYRLKIAVAGLSDRVLDTQFKKEQTLTTWKTTESAKTLPNASGYPTSVDIDFYDVFSSSATSRFAYVYIQSISYGATSQYSDGSHYGAYTNSTYQQFGTSYAYRVILDALPTYDVATTSTAPYYVQSAPYTVSISNATAQYGGTIASSYITIGSQTVWGSGDGTLSVTLESAGTYTPQVTVTDSRGQTTTKNLDQITVLPNTIEISDLDTYRVSNVSGTSNWIPDDEGTYSIIEMEMSYPNAPGNMLEKPIVSIGGTYYTNSVDWYESYDSETGALSNPITWTEYFPTSPKRIYGFLNYELSQNNAYTYQVTARIYNDNAVIYINSEVITSTIGIAFFLLAGRAGGKGLGIGMKPPDDNLYINMDTYLKGVSGAIGYIFDLIYPVGSIYTSVNSTDPELLFGGEWERITGKFLLAATDGGAQGGNSRADIEAGYSGGEPTHLLLASESGQKAGSTANGNATHSHNPSTTTEYFVTCATAEANNTRVAYSSSGNRLVDGMTNTSTSVFHHRKASDSQNASHAHNITGSDATTEHNNMPPYLAVYVWQRIA